MKLGQLALAAATALAMAVGLTGASAQDKGLENPRSAAFHSGLEGKKVVFLPLSMGFDLTEGWAARMRNQAKRLNYDFQIRDPAWSTDAGTRALQSLISEKPDLIVAHNPDIQSYARLLAQAQAAGIKVVQINLESNTQTDSYVGADWTEIGEQAALAVVDKCGAGKGKSTKVAIDTGVPTAASDVFQLDGIYRVLKKHPEIQVVSQQATEYNAEKARSIMETVLQQHPDLCAGIGIWDNQDTGTASAIKAAGKSDQVFLVTSGGGNRVGCENVTNGNFSLYISYNVPLQGDLLNQEIARLLLSKSKAGETKTMYFNPLTLITKDNVNQRNCWTLDDIK
ncbi:ribose transport system substrate-binding protein [Roseiarcus fermentans]|uniref:Ribose transport system substrate-binding protein n=1 Tax=Roseiarcus fermentans TaxID=1473586 RepID=A0A366FU95_9HYPH|nr:sugar ABC transporter substrate-binding protein [Roseiarcus fermentans]RBP18198.1 ribose transport system substrate-binding protein [Roseiarcus fermentans]